jgi:ribosomal protein S18 acetylase RimI-like enzyme
VTGALIQDYVIRRELRPGDADKIPELHDRIYSAEYGLDGRSRAYVERSVQAALDHGWPAGAGAVWLVDRGDQLAGTLALTPEGDGVGAVHWFVLAPELRGRGLGRELFGELMDEAQAAGLRRIVLETFSELTTAARIYREAGLRVVSEQQFDGWGPKLTIQRYELQLR